MAIDQTKTPPTGSDTLNWPNALSLFRAFLGLPVIALVTYGGAEAWIAAIVVMGLAELTDALDGILARRSGRVTDIGKVIDPMADSLYRALVFLSFLSVGWMSVWLVAVIFIRDIVVAYVRTLSQQIGITMAARASGKFKAAIQAFAQFSTLALYAAADWGAGDWGAAIPALEISTVLLIVAAVFTAYSGFDYVRSFLVAANNRH